MTGLYLFYNISLFTILIWFSIYETEEYLTVKTGPFFKESGTALSGARGVAAGVQPQSPPLMEPLGFYAGP